MRLPHQPNCSAPPEAGLEKKRPGDQELLSSRCYKTNKARGLPPQACSSSYTLAVIVLRAVDLEARVILAHSLR
jgi:hypothetical protein